MTSAASHHRVVIAGSGFGGIGMAVRLREEGIDDFVILERAADLGGTWRDNSYPGCACDVPSHVYSFSFAPNPNWSRTFSPAPEIWAYLRRVAQERDVVRSMRFGHEVRDASWDEEAGVWRLDTTRGPYTCDVFVAAMGLLADPAIPALPGVERFTGARFHSARWDHAHDLAGERVAVIGTGASAVQFVPQIQPRVGTLHLFQRTASWVVPRRDRSVHPLERRVYRRAPALQRAMRSGIYAARELNVVTFRHPRLMGLGQRVATAHLHRQVTDPGLRDKLTPSFRMGCKRILISNDYYPALTQPNVEVVTAGIAEVRERSIVDTDGVERAVDAIVYGTGFHVTDAPVAQRIRGRGGVALSEASGGSLVAHRGTTVAGFPNLFWLLGPNTGLGHNSVVNMIEAQIDYALDALRHMDAAGLRAVEVRPDAQDAYNRAVQHGLEGTVWTAGGCHSWYEDRNGRNTALWPGWTDGFRRATRRFDPAEYDLVSRRRST